LLATAVVAVLTAVAGGARLWDEYHQRAAQQAFDKQQQPEALRHLEARLRLRPHSAELHLLAARTARRGDDVEGASRHLDACDRLQGVTQAAALERALLRAQQGDLTGVEADLRQRVKPDDADSVLILEALAKGYIQTDRWMLAYDSLGFLLSQDPNHVPGLLMRGLAREKHHHLDEARQDYERAVDLAPDSAEARLRLADMLADLGEVRTAVAHYEYLRARPPVAADAVLGLARCRLDLHELDEAECLLQGLLAEQPDDLAATAEWGQVLLRQGRAAEAEPRLRAAVERAPSAHDVRQALYLCLQAQEKRDEAAECLRRLRQIEDDIMRIGLLQGRLAEGECDELATRCEIGRLMLRCGRETEGVRWLNLVLAANPTWAPAHEALADYYEHNNRPSDAARHRRAAEGGAPPTPPGRP
jgi:tetratricopeptide (TPR) repeat protein